MIDTKKVVVATVSQTFDAMPLQIKLGSQGIKTELNGDLIVSANPLLSNAIGGVQILVSITDADRATTIVNEFHQEEAEKENERLHSCPKCGSKNGGYVKRNILTAIAIVTFIRELSLLLPWSKYKCPDCGHKWR